MGILDLPQGTNTSDQRWQNGYYDGCNEVKPINDDPVYVSGWCYGFCGGCQCSLEEAEEAYKKAKQDLPVKEWL